MTPIHTVDTIDKLRAEEPISGATLLVLGYHTPGDGGGGIFRPDPTSTENDDGGMIIAPNDQSNGRWKRVYDGSVSVKYFGAQALGDKTSDTVAANNRAAIQAAINFAVNPNHPHSAAVITFPASTSTTHSDIAEYKIDDALVLPRLPYYAYIVLRGDGQRVSQITRTTAGPLMICDQDAANVNPGSYLIEHLALAVKSGSRAFDWTPPNDGDISRPEIHFNEMFFNGGAGDVVGLVHIQRGHRCRFYNCEFTGLDTGKGDKTKGTTGVAIWLEEGSGATIINSRSIGNSGALIKCSKDGELVMINCRSEGAKDQPAFDFEDSDIITLIQPTNEGIKENPALFRFTNCSQVLVMNPTLAYPEHPYRGNKYADGMLFQKCENFTVIQPMAKSSFTQIGDKSGDYSTRAIRIDKDCRYGIIRGLHVKHHASDTDVTIEEGAKHCYVEVLSDGRDQSPGSPGGLVGMGTLVADALRGSNGFYAVGSQQQHDNGLPPPHRVGYDLELGGGDGYEPGKDLAGNTIIQLGKPGAGGNTAQLLLQKGPQTVFGRLWYEANTYLKLESMETALHLQSDQELVLEAQGDLNFTAGDSGILPTFLWRGNGGHTTRTDTMPHDQPNHHNYAATVPLITWQHNGNNRFSFNRTGLAFNDKTPIAKPTVTGSRDGNTALTSLLSALDALGLIRDETTL